MPDRMATRSMWSIEPSSIRSAGIRSSVQKQMAAWFSAVIKGSSGMRLRVVVPSRMNIVSPKRSFSRASATVVHSCSLWTPAAV